MFYNIVIEKKPENGASCYEVLQFKISSMEQTYNKAQQAIEAQGAKVDLLRAKLIRCKNHREHFNLSIEVDVETQHYKAMVDRAQNLYYEIKGMRKTLDTILFITNYGGELTDKNRRQIESILNT